MIASPNEEWFFLPKLFAGRLIFLFFPVASSGNRQPAVEDPGVPSKTSGHDTFIMNPRRFNSGVE